MRRRFMRRRFAASLERLESRVLLTADVDLVVDLNPNKDFGDVRGFETETNGHELWSTDGTAEGTELVDLYPGTASSDPVLVGSTGDELLLIAAILPSGRELHRLTIADDATPLPGDFDGDGDVDVEDRTRLTQNWTGAVAPGTGNARFEDGDADGDGDIDSADLTLLINNWTGAIRASNVQASKREIDSTESHVFDELFRDLEIELGDPMQRSQKLLTSPFLA